MATVLVTVLGPRGIHDLELPGDTPVSAVIPLLVEVCVPQLAGGPWTGSSYWGLGPAGEKPFAPDWTLIESGVVDGMILAFQDHASWSGQPTPPAEPEAAAEPEAPVAQDGGVGIAIRWNRDVLTP